MAKTSGVWGIDIGRCALKALRCRLDGDAVVADGFDYIEYPKLLTQPEADAVQLVKEALEQFLSRNSVRGDKVAISVSGESGLARYFKPPPVDAKKIADIVKYEAKQQIPFALEDVIWDFQRMAGGQEVDGFVLDSEIGLFAMKREQVQKALQPFTTAGIEVDIIQLAPICVYNYAAYDLIKPLPEGEEYNSEAPPPSTVVLSIGTDTTDLVITNGYRVWQRNIPLGGNHFTKQLSKDLKLTFAKAEHLKRNPKTADDPKTIFQAMRPVFGDMVTEVQRSVGFFQSLDRKAKIASVTMLGNTVKLPGLTQYLSKHLGYDIKEIDSFGKLTGASVVTSPSFKDNLLTFSTCYGLCLQGLGKGKLSTNLLPREITIQRMIQAKKPWAIATLGAAMLAFGLSFIFYYRTLEAVHPDRTYNNVSWKDAGTAAKDVQGISSRYTTEDDEKKAKLKKLKDFGTEVLGTGDRKLLWLELLVALNQSLPSTPGVDPKLIPDHKEKAFNELHELHLDYVETQYYSDLQQWWTAGAGDKYKDAHKQALEAATSQATATPPPATGTTPPVGTPASEAGPSATPSAGAQAEIPGPKGPGWIVEVKGHHFFHDPNNRRAGGAQHVRDTFMKNLSSKTLSLPGGPGKPPELFTMSELGIGYVILVTDPIPVQVKLANPNATGSEAQGNTGSFGPGGGIPGGGSPGGGGPGGSIPGGGGAGKRPDAAKEDPNNPSTFTVTQYDFIVQFVWQEKPLNVRREERKTREAELAKAQSNAPQNPVAPTAPVAPVAPTLPPAPNPMAVAPDPAVKGPVPPDNGPVAAPMPDPAAENTPMPPAAPTPAVEAVPVEPETPAAKG